jgi:hypothetical protein
LVEALAESERKVFWLDSPEAPEPLSPLEGDRRCGLAVVACAGGTRSTRLELVRSRPIPFPPEPLRYATVQATRRALARADERGGRRRPVAATA